MSWIHFAHRLKRAGARSGSSSQAQPAAAGAPRDFSKYVKPSDDFLKKVLTPIQYSVTQHDDTETPFRNTYWDNHAEGIYAATEVTRRCLAEALAEKVERGELREEHALRIGAQVMRENALELFPSLRDRLWKHRGVKLTPPPTPR